MSGISLQTDPAVQVVFERYPSPVRERMEQLRSLVLQVAEETESVEQLEETLKWGEPSYLTKHGSTLRMDWKAKKPEQCGLYFQCTSQLVPTFRVIYPDVLQFEGNRAIVLPLAEELPVSVIKRCMATAMRYQKLKHEPLLGL